MPIPDIQSSPLFDAQSVPDASDWQNITDGFSVTGLISGCVVSAYGTPAMGVQVSAGSVACSGIITAVAAASVTIPTASTSDRRDMIAVNSSGSVFVVMGTPCGTAGWTRTTYPGLPPVKPAIPNNCVFLGEVYVAATTTSITSGNIEVSGTQLFVTSQYVTSFNTRGGAVLLDQADIESTFTALGQIPIGTGTNTGEYLSVGSVGTVLTSQGASVVPQWLPQTGSGAASAGVQSFNTRYGPVTFLLSDAESVYTAKGQIMVGTGTNSAELLSPSASVGYVLTSNGAASIPSWQAAPSASVTAVAIEATFTGAGKIYVGTGSGTGEQLTSGSVGYVLTGNGAASVPSWQPAAGGAMNLISSQVLATAAASITFSGIPNTYNHLVLMFIGRCNAAVEATSLSVQLNGDTGSNYDISSIIYNGTTVSGITTAAHTSWQVETPDTPGTTTTAGVPGRLRLEIPLYAGTTFQKQGYWESGYLDLATATTDTGINRMEVLWRNTAAISSITLFPDAGSFISGSAAYLYGIL